MGMGTKAIETNLLICFICFMGACFTAVGCFTPAWLVWDLGVFVEDENPEGGTRITEQGMLGSYQLCTKTYPTNPKEAPSDWLCVAPEPYVKALDPYSPYLIPSELHLTVMYTSLIATVTSFLGAFCILGKTMSWFGGKSIGVFLHLLGAFAGLGSVGIYAAVRPYYYTTLGDVTVTWVGYGYSFFLTMVGSTQCLIGALSAQVKISTF